MQTRRAEWIEQIHRAAPGTDWRGLEAANRMETFFLQQSQPLQASAIAWTERGAGNITGRTFDCANMSSGELLVGSANGGLFRGVPGSGAWTPLSGHPGYAVEHVLVVPGPVDHIVVASNSQLYFSADGGAAWSVPSGLPESISGVARLVQEANAPLTSYALVEGWIWTGSAWDHNWHLLRSVDGGSSFVKVHSEPLATRPDVWVSRTSKGPLYMAVGNVMKTSADHGVTWTTVGTLPVSGSETRLAGSEAGAPTFYCAVRAGGTWQLLRSVNAGVSWTPLVTLSDFYGTLVATITNPNQVIYGGVDAHRSLNGGTIWSLVNNWYDYYSSPQTKLHADIFGLRCLLKPPPALSPASARSPGVAAVQEVIYIHTDGGMYTLDPAAAVPDNATRLGFRNAQYYGTLSSTVSSDQLSAGSQDQGYQVSHAGLGTLAPDFTQVISGDYAHLVSSWPDRSRMVWSVYPAFAMLQTGAGDAVGLETSNFPDFPAGASGFRFLPATAADPDDPSAAYVGARYLWRVRRSAPGVFSWTTLPWDFDAGSGDVVGAVAWAPSAHARGLVASYSGRLYYTTNRGVSWTPSVVLGPPSHYFAGSSIVIDPVDSLKAWVGGSGYSNPGVYRTIDGGVSWTPMANGLPPTQVFALTQESPQSPVLYAATHAGPFRWDGTSWQNLLTTTCCAPLTDYWHVEALPQFDRVRFSTYGRGIWDYATGGTAGVSTNRTGHVLALTVSPNPARSRSSVAFTLATAGVTDVELFDLTGRQLLSWLRAGAKPAASRSRSNPSRTRAGSCRAGSTWYECERARPSR